MRRSLTVLLVAAGFAAFALPAVASHSWGGYHWARTANPFTIKAIDANTAAWRPYLDAALADWNQSAVMNLAKETAAADKRCRAVAGKAKSCNAAYGRNGWLGLAQIWASGSHIMQATAKLNDTYFSMASYNSPVKKQHVMCQEIGHDWGLGHQDESGADLNTCMDYSSLLDNPHPDQHDYDQLELIYSHLDSGTTIATGLAGTEGSVPARVEREDRISTSTIIETFRDGTRRITHVTWALEERGNSKSRAFDPGA